MQRLFYEDHDSLSEYQLSLPVNWQFVSTSQAVRFKTEIFVLSVALILYADVSTTHTPSTWSIQSFIEDICSIL